MRVIVEIGLQDACTLGPSLLSTLALAKSKLLVLCRAWTGVSPPSVHLVSSLLLSLSALSKVGSSQIMCKEIAIITWRLLCTEYFQPYDAEMRLEGQKLSVQKPQPQILSHMWRSKSP